MIGLLVPGMRKWNSIASIDASLVSATGGRGDSFSSFSSSLLFSPLLFSGNVLVTLGALLFRDRCLSCLLAASALDFALWDKCRLKLGITSEPSRACNQPTEMSAELNPS